MILMSHRDAIAFGSYTSSPARVRSKTFDHRDCSNFPLGVVEHVAVRVGDT